MIKEEARLIGIDDMPFTKHQKKVKLVGVIYRGGKWIEGVLSCEVRKDGKDATKKIIEMINRSRFKNQLKAIFLGGITVAGFNVVDIKEVYDKTNIPVVALSRKYPDFEKIFKALKKLNKKKEIEIIERTMPPVRMNHIFVQWAGCSIDRVKELLEISCTHSYFPEPLRAAHLIAAGIALGESKGRV